MAAVYQKVGRYCLSLFKTNGKFLIVEFHPFIWTLDHNFEKIYYSYFHEDEPIAETLKGTYADRDADIEMIEYGWNHSLSDVINSLIDEGLEILSFKEFPFSPYNCLPNMKELTKEKYVFEKFSQMLPIVYSIKAEKK